MVKEFSKEVSLVFVFSEDFQYVIYNKDNGKLDGFFYASNDLLEVSKNFYNRTNILIEPGKWNTVLSLPRIDKSYKINVISTTADLSKHLDFSDKYVVTSSYDSPSICHPSCRWLVPLILDPMIHASQFNQIILQA